MQRMVAANGQEVGPARVWLRTSWIPGLAMSRVIGDTVAHSVGVVAEPQVSTHELDDKDRFLVVASDGVFEFLSNHDVAGIVGRCDTAEMACRVLVQESASRWERDGGWHRRRHHCRRRQVCVALGLLTQVHVIVSGVDTA